MNKTDKGVLISLIGVGILSLAGTWIWTINQENEVQIKRSSERAKRIKAK
jgi:hypothetical protein